MLKKLCFLAICFFTEWNAVFAQSVTDLQTLKMFKRHIYYLASDSLEGRGTGTEGEQKAAQYIISEFLAIGLHPLGDHGTYLQKFTYTAGKEYGEKNSLIINVENRKTEFTKAGEDYYPLDYSANGTAEGKLIFTGYGINAPTANYNDYQNLTNLEGNIFLMEISSPDGMHPHSKYAEFSDIRTKIDLAIAKGATGIIFINSDSTAEDPKRNHDLKISPSRIPVVFLKDKTLLGNPFAMKPGKNIGTAAISVDLINIPKSGNNVVGFLDNKAKNTVIIGAHYDHLGYGEHGSLYRGERAIHNGADDNASGTAMLIELARKLKNSSEKNNNYLFIAFSGEELGLYGSSHYAKNPTLNLENVNYMLNMDMVGRLEKEKGMSVLGAGTSPVWKDLLGRIIIDSLKIKTSESGVGPSDHTSFYLQNIPVLHFFTGTHEDYHKPSDDADKINFMGMLTVKKLIIAVIDSLNEKEKLVFIKTKEDSAESTPRFTVTLGVIPDYLYEGEGMKIDGITDGKPAQKAGILKGDIIIRMGENKVVDMMSYMKALSRFKKGDAVKVIVKRGNEEKEFNVTF